MQFYFFLCAVPFLGALFRIFPKDGGKGEIFNCTIRLHVTGNFYKNFMKVTKMQSILESGETILFIGDSITDCGRRNNEKPLGAGYVKLFHDLMAIREPEKNITIINRGIGGNTVIDLQNRWSDDAVSLKPDFISIKIGINDLHRQFRPEMETIDPDKFEKTFDQILSRTVGKLPECKLLLIDPFYLSTDTSPHSFRKQVLDILPGYIEVVHKMSSKYQTRLVKTHEMFQNLLNYHRTDLFCPEPVHPNLTGHLAIAEAVYSALAK